MKAGKGLQGIIVVLLLGFLVHGRAQQPGPEPVRMPDIRANIMNMLRESKGTSESSEEDLFAEAERQRKEKEQPLKPVAVEPQPAHPPQQTEIASPVENLPVHADKHVKLPVKEIVIEDLDDLKKLADELKKAKKRQAGE